MSDQVMYFGAFILLKRLKDFSVGLRKIVISAMFFRMPAMARSVTSSPFFALTDILIWSAEPGLSEIGFGEKSAYRPLRAAIVRTTEINVLVLSAEGRA